MHILCLSYAYLRLISSLSQAFFSPNSDTPNIPLRHLSGILILSLGIWLITKMGWETTSPSSSWLPTAPRRPGWLGNHVGGSVAIVAIVAIVHLGD